jgi:hypothetical protein
MYGKKWLVLAAALATSAGVEAAGTGPTAYLEGNYVFLQDKSGPYSVSPTVAAIRGGMAFGPYWGLEAVAATGASDGTLGAATVRIDNAYGAFGKGMYPLNQTITFFARAGYMHWSSSASAPGLAATASVSSTAFGAGVEAHLGKHWYLMADYMQYYNSTNETITGPAVGVGARF